jgi:hypothetical protein
MTPADVVDWLDDLITVPTLAEQLAFIHARPDLFPPERPAASGTVAYNFKPGLPLDAMLGGAGGAIGADVAAFGHVEQARRMEQAAYNDAHRRASAEYAEAHAVGIIERSQREIAKRRLQAGNLPPAERAALLLFLEESR